MAVARDSPGWRYLVARRMVWPADLALPAAVRWLPAAAAGTGLRLPNGAAGALCYLFARPGEAEARALQYEAVNARGERLVSGNGAKRLSVRGSEFGSGRRVFVARPADDGVGGVHLCEGPLDALALVHLARLGAVNLGGAAVVGAAGTGNFRPAALAGWPVPVSIWPDGDAAGAVAAVQLATALRRTGRDVTIRDAGGGDVADWAVLATVEREGMHGE